MANEVRLIDANDMKTAFRQWFDHEDFRTMNQVIDDVPTVDAVEVVHGRWVSSMEQPRLIYECSVCKDKWSYGAMLNMKYCPNCGAKMDGDGNGST